MKKIILSSCTLLGLLHTQAQTSGTLDANNIKAYINTEGMLFKDPVSGDPGFEAPKGSGNHTLNGSNILVGGKTAADILKLATSNLGFLNDFQAGPIDPVTNLASTNPLFNRVWKIDLGEINNHMANYTTSGYVPSDIIAQWPAYGNAYYGTEDGGAPFFDHDGDMEYDPMQGDYPLIQGTQAVYQVLNDLQPHETMSQPLGIEIRCMAYVFGCSTDSALSNTVFVHYELLSRATTTYYETYIGINNDMQIGNPTDNFTGCDVQRGMYYGYNGDGIDDADVAATNYGMFLPVQGVTILNGPFDDPDLVNNQYYNIYSTAVAYGGITYEGLGVGYGDTITDNERLGLRHFMSYANGISPEMFAPGINDVHFYNGLKGLWNDGAQPVYGGIGYPGYTGTTTTPVDYLYYDYSDSSLWASRGVPVPANWSEGMGGNTPTARKTMGSMGPFTLQPGDYNEVDVAYTFARQYAIMGDPLAALPMLQVYVDSIRSYFKAGTTPCGDFAFNAISENKKDDVSFNVYPNPVTDRLFIGLKNTGDFNAYTLRDISGRIVASGNISQNISSIDMSGLGNGIYLLSLTGKYARTKTVVAGR